MNVSFLSPESGAVLKVEDVHPCLTDCKLSSACVQYLAWHLRNEIIIVFHYALVSLAV